MDSESKGRARNGVATAKHVKKLLLLAAVLNTPGMLIWIPWIGILFQLPFLFWINIPVLWLGLRNLVGKQHYEISAFGASPQTAVGWFLIVAFWTLLAGMVTVVAAYLPEMKWRFSLRTMLVVTTLVAVVLGLACFSFL